METVVRLKPGEEDRLLRGHPWIFDGEVESAEPPGEPGAVARLRAADGRDLGVGHFNPKSRIRFRWLAKDGPLDKGFYLSRLREALAKREALFPGEDAYRLCFGESDGLPGLVVDRYGKHLAVQLLSAGMDRAWPDVQAALVELLDPAGIQLRNDNGARRLEGLPLEVRTALGTVPEQAEIREGGLRYLVPLGAGQKTGFYFDQRQNREFLAPYFKGRRVADLHTYVGAFALKAASSGARLVLGLDSSDAAVKLARANARLNGLQAKVKFEEGDAAAFLNELAGAPKAALPDMILLDPPNFAHSKADLPAAERAYARLFSKALKRLKPGGLLAVSTCSRHVTEAVFRRLLAESGRLAGRRTETLALRRQSEDHPVHPAMPETEYLHFSLLKAV